MNETISDTVPGLHIDVVVLDPPYVHHGRNSAPLRARRYGGRDTTAGFDHRAIIDLYQRGMTEAARVLRPGGTLWVKCQDEVESARQRRSHIEVHVIAVMLGLRDQDLFILASPPSQTGRWRRQVHARKAHSYLWVFRRA